MAMARVEFMYWLICISDSSSSEVMTTIETASAEPSRQNMSATVVDVGSPSELYMSSRIMLASITDR